MARRSEPEPKIGAGTAEAYFRQGLRELRGALYTESNVAQQTDYGIWGNSTPGEVAQARQAEVQTLEEERGSILESRIQQAEAVRDERGRDEKDFDRE